MNDNPVQSRPKDSYYGRRMAAIYTGRLLREMFSNATLTVEIPDEGRAFGVIEWGADGKVQDAFVEAARTILKREYDFDDPVVALPFPSSAEKAFWRTPSDYTLKMKLDG